jgi:hypothetical protein
MPATAALAKPAQAAKQPARAGCGVSDRSTSHEPMLTAAHATTAPVHARRRRDTEEFWVLGEPQSFRIMKPSPRRGRAGRGCGRWSVLSTSAEVALAAGPAPLPA